MMSYEISTFESMKSSRRESGSRADAVVDGICEGELGSCAAKGLVEGPGCVLLELLLGAVEPWEAEV